MRLALLLAICGCAPRPRVVFAPYVLPVPTPIATERATLGLLHDLHRHRLTELSDRGRTLAKADIEALPAEVVVAAFAVTARPRPTQWFDVWAPTPSGDRRPVSVHIHGRVVDLAYGEPVPLRKEGPTATVGQRDQVAEQFGIRRIAHGDREWSEAALHDLTVALAHLEPVALAALSGLEVRRMGVSPRAAGRELAWFDPQTEPPRIDVYDLAFDGASAAVGPVDGFYDVSVMTIVHELGHAIADWPLRQAWLAARRAEPEQTHAARATLRALGSTGPVIEAWRAVRDGPGPTDYGARRLHESFAEAYALSRLDPQALREVMPQAAKWFSDGGHLEAAGLASVPSGG